MGQSKENQDVHSLGHNKRNNDNTIQVRAAKCSEFQRQTVQEKSPETKTE